MNLVHLTLRHVAVCVGLSLSLGSFLPCPVQAAVVEYTDRAAWLAAVGSVTNVDFEGIAPPGGETLYVTPAGLTLSGVNFLAPQSISPSGFSEEVVSGDVPYVGSWGSGDKLQAGEVEVDMTLPKGVTAVGSDIMVTLNAVAPGSPSQTYTATLSTGETFTNIPSSPPPHRSFIGFISTSPIASLKLVSSATFPMIDNVAFSAVPEPSTVLLIVVALLAMRLFRRL